MAGQMGWLARHWKHREESTMSNSMLRQVKERFCNILGLLLVPVWGVVLGLLCNGDYSVLYAKWMSHREMLAVYHATGSYPSPEVSLVKLPLFIGSFVLVYYLPCLCRRCMRFVLKDRS